MKLKIEYRPVYCRLWAIEVTVDLSTAEGWSDLVRILKEDPEAEIVSAV